MKTLTLDLKSRFIVLLNSTSMYHTYLVASYIDTTYKV